MDSEFVNVIRIFLSSINLYDLSSLRISYLHKNILHSGLLWSSRLYRAVLVPSGTKTNLTVESRWVGSGEKR